MVFCRYPRLQVFFWGTVWQELWDPGSGHPYYWNPVTNELTWEKPAELLKPRPAIKSKEESTPVEDAPPVRGPLMYPTILTSVEEDPSPPALDFKVSFKLSAADKTKKPDEIAKKVPSVDVDLVIAEIEKEVPPDHKKEEPFVPLFKRRKMDNGTSSSALLNFKNYFQPSRSDSVLPFIEEPEKGESKNPLIINTHRGLGFHESRTETELKSEVKEEKIQFVKGETLVPMTVPEPAPTLEEKVVRLRNQLETSSSNLLILNAYDEAYNLKKLDQDFFESWIDHVILQPDEKNSPKEEAKETEPKEVDQVIDMVLDDSASESSESNPPAICSESTSAADGLDSALDSFYSDLATLDATASVESVPEQVAVGSTEEPSTSDSVGAVPAQEISADLTKKGIKRSKMSHDMSSLVAKWQKINQNSKS